MNNKTITKSEIETILKKYQIGKKPLSKVLGWGEITIIRYLEGSTPSKLHSSILLDIKNNPNKFSEYLENNKHLITNVAYRKTKNQLKKLTEKESQTPINYITKYILSQNNDITFITLQQILFYIEGFSLALLNKNILLSNPTIKNQTFNYLETSDYFQNYNYLNTIHIETNNLPLNKKYLKKEEQELINEIINILKYYSSYTIMEITKIIFPDLLKNIEPTEEDIYLAFKKICYQNQIKTSSDVSEYIKKIFQRIVK